jgi:hypothetical protein
LPRRWFLTVPGVVTVGVGVAWAVLGSERSPPPDRFAGRNGATEAARDAVSGRPLKLYSHVRNDVAPGWGSTGMLNCSPGNVSNHGVFEMVDELASQEAEVPPPEQDQQIASAAAFTDAYNRTVLRLRRRDVLALCPEVQEAPPRGR